MALGRELAEAGGDPNARGVADPDRRIGPLPR
jgi:hypothetical protein